MDYTFQKQISKNSKVHLLNNLYNQNYFFQNTYFTNAFQSLLFISLYALLEEHLDYYLVQNSLLYLN